MKHMKTPLYQKIEEQYEENIVLPQILQERQKLNQIKLLHHRVDLNEIKLHQIKHKEQKMLIEQVKSDRLKINNVKSMRHSPSQLIQVRA
jgi:superfamily I DNA and RNA helicase